MYDKRLDAVIAAAETGSFAQAARRLSISTPALAKQINTFEREYGLTLFARSRSGVTPTETGADFIEDAIIIRRQCREMLRKAQRRAVSEAALVRLGVSILRSGRRIIDLWQRDAGRHPQIRLELVSMPDDTETIDSLITHLGESVDMIATAFDASYWGDVCSTLTLDREPLCVAVPRDHALARRPFVSLPDLEGARLHLLSRHHGGNDRARDLLERHPAIELVDIDHYDLDTFNECAQSGDLLISKPMWDDVHPQLVNVPVDWPEPIGLDYGLLYPRDPSPAVTAFIERIRELSKSRPTAG